MPVDRANKKFDCDYPGCDKAFGRPYDLQRHKQVHCVYEERQFVCPVAGCGFRANQQGGLKCHINSIHENLRLPCGEAGCTKSFSDPSSRSKHRQKCHTTADEASGSSQRARVRKKKHSAAYPVSVHARVARHVEEHSGQDAKDILNQFATFAVHTSNPATPSSDDGSSNSTRRSASHSAPSAPSTSVYRPNYTIQPSLCELPGVFHRANDIQSDGWSINTNIQTEHQAYDANPRAAPTSWGYYPLTNQPRHPEPVQGDFDLSRASPAAAGTVLSGISQWPLCGSQQDEDQIQGEGWRGSPSKRGILSFFICGSRSCASIGSSSSDSERLSSTYPRPNPRMLLDIR